MTQTKQIRFVLIAMLSTAVIIPAVRANPASEAKRGIQTALFQRNQARQQRDLKAFLATFTLDWVTMNVSGKTGNYATLRKSVSAIFAHAHAPTSRAEQFVIKSVSSNGQTAHIIISTRINYPVRKRPTGSVYSSQSTTSSETWLKGAAGWQEQRGHLLVDNIRFSAMPMPTLLFLH